MRDIKFNLDLVSKELSLLKPPKRLIITSGDTSDVDGFLALAEYSKVKHFYPTLCNPIFLENIVLIDCAVLLADFTVLLQTAILTVLFCRLELMFSLS